MPQFRSDEGYGKDNYDRYNENEQTDQTSGLKQGSRNGVVGLGERSFAGGRRTKTGDFLSKTFDPAGIFAGGVYAQNPNFDASLGLGLGGNQLDQMGMDAQGRRIDPAVYDMLLAQAQGRAPSVAEMQLGTGLEMQQRQALSMMKSNPNVSPEMAQRMANDQMATNSQVTNQQAAMLRAQEMSQAQGQLAGFTLQQQAMNDAMTQFYMQQGFSRAEAELKARQELSKQQLEAQTANMQSEYQQRGAAAGVAGGIIGGMTKSDRRLKENIEQIPSNYEKIGLRGYKWTWKDDGRSATGVIAQEVQEKYPQAVSEVDGFLMVHYGLLDQLVREAA